MKRFLLALLAPLALFPLAAVAHEGHAHKVMGVVAAVDASHVEVKAKDGKTMSIALDAKTKVVRGKAAAAASDIAPGSRVVVTMMEEGGAMKAMEVQLPEVPAPKK